MTDEVPAAPKVPKPTFTAPVEENEPPAADLAVAEEPQTAIAVAEPPAPSKQAYFCLEAGHPGASTPRADHFEMSRMFYPTNATGAPICPLCRKQVSAIPVDDTSKLPPSVQAIADRLNTAERNR